MGKKVARQEFALTKNDVAQIHKKEWEAFRQAILIKAADSGDPQFAQFARLIASSIQIAQEGERKAWGFTEGEADNQIVVSWGIDANKS